MGAYKKRLVQEEILDKFFFYALIPLKGAAEAFYMSLVLLGTCGKIILLGRNTDNVVSDKGGLH